MRIITSQNFLPIYTCMYLGFCISEHVSKMDINQVKKMRAEKQRNLEKKKKARRERANITKT